MLGACLSGCFRATFEDAPHPPPGEQRAAYRSHFLLGVVGSTQVDVRDYCRSGEAQQVRIGGNVGTTVIGVVTAGVYTPRMVYITCTPAPEQP
jgi:hypothetical protein